MPANVDSEGCPKGETNGRIKKTVSGCLNITFLIITSQRFAKEKAVGSLQCLLQHSPKMSFGLVCLLPASPAKIGHETWNLKSHWM